MFKSYFWNRSQIVFCELSLKCGVAQGSLLGPLCFTLYINDLPYNLTDHSILYADDTTVVTSGRSEEELEKKMTVIESEVNIWFDANRLVTNKVKSIKMHISTKRFGMPNTAKFLGISIDSRLSWKPHCEVLSIKLSSCVYAIRRTSNIAGHQAALVAYFALFQSPIAYCILLWGATPHSAGIFLQQKKAV